MEFDDKDKIDILLNQLNERYSAHHKMRERSLRFALWVLGIGLTITWAILTEEKVAVVTPLILYTFTVSIFSLALYFIKSIQNGFNNNQKVIERLETALGLHTDGFFLSEATILPKQYIDVEQRKVWSGHFITLYVWVAAVCFFVLLAIRLTQTQAPSTISSTTPISEKMVHIKANSYQTDRSETTGTVKK